MTAGMVVTEHPAGHATYRGDQRHIVGESKGPTTYGSYVHAVTAEYDGASDRTRVGFVHLRPVES